MVFFGFIYSPDFSKAWKTNCASHSIHTSGITWDRTKDLDLLSAGSQSHLSDPNAPRDGARDARDGRDAHDSRDGRDGGDAHVGLGGVVGSRVARGEGKSGGPHGGAEDAFGNSEKKGRQ